MKRTLLLESNWKRLIFVSSLSSMGCIFRCGLKAYLRAVLSEQFWLESSSQGCSGLSALKKKKSEKETLKMRARFASMAQLFFEVVEIGGNGSACKVVDLSRTLFLPFCHVSRKSAS